MRRLALFLALAACLLLALAPLAAGAAAQNTLSRAAPPPDPEAYAVWAAALDAVFAGDTTYERLTVWVDTLATSLDEPPPERRPLARALGHYHLSFEPLDALLAADSPAVRVDVGRLAGRTRLHLARPPAGRAERDALPRGVGSLQLSRVSFFPGRRLALVEVFITYCNRCGKGALLIMARRDDGTWALFRLIRGAYA